MNKLLTLTIGLMLFLQPSSFSQENNLMIAEMLLKVSETHVYGGNRLSVTLKFHRT